MARLWCWELQKRLVAHVTQYPGRWSRAAARSVLHALLEHVPRFVSMGPLQGPRRTLFRTQPVVTPTPSRGLGAKQNGCDGPAAL